MLDNAFPSFGRKDKCPGAVLTLRHHCTQVVSFLSQAGSPTNNGEGFFLLPCCMIFCDMHATGFGLVTGSFMAHAQGSWTDNKELAVQCYGPDQYNQGAEASFHQGTLERCLIIA
jgi:hypothetical protein